MDVQIDEVVTDLIVTDPHGALSREELRTIIQTVLQHLRAEQHNSRQREKDTGVRDRAYQAGDSADQE